MAAKETLFDLFGDLIAGWPSRVIQPEPGIVGPGSSPPDVSVWLTRLNNGVTLENVRMGAAGDRVSVEARIKLDNSPTGTASLNGFPFVLAAMPDVEFRIPEVLGPDKFIQLFASVSERGAEVVLERLPVEILLPLGLVEPHPNTEGHPSGVSEVKVGSFSAGGLDDLEVTLRSGNPTSIKVHIRLHVNEDGEIDIRPSVPISFGQCVLSGMPCRAVHDFSLIPSPELVPNNFDWIRHTVEPWAPSLSGTLTGLFAVRSVDIDSQEEPFKDASQWLNQHSEKEAAAEFVLDDTVVPFFSPWVIPVPRHITFGVRRRVLDPSDAGQVFKFDRAPVQIFFNRGPLVALIIESFFFKSLPSEELSRDLGLSFSAGLVFADEQTVEGDPKIDQHALLIELGENYTPRIGYRREFSTADNLPAPGTGAGQVINRILHWEIATIQIDIMAFRIGYSLGRAIGENASFGDSAEATVDLFVSMPPTGADDSFFQLRALNGEKVAFAIEGLGWRQGSFQLKGVAMPDGVVAMFGPVKIIIQEIGLLAENGASYLSFSAGVAFPLPSGFEGAVVLKRLRFRVAGNKDAPFFKLDGFFARVKGPAVLIEAGGFFTEKMVGPARVREFGLTGTVMFELSAIEYLFGLDLLVGSTKSPAEEFDYFMFQIFFRGSVTISWFELRGARVLFANNMQPKLGPVDRDAQSLRYFNWYKSTNPINVPGDRRLAAWQARKGSWSLGIGVSASIAGIGKVLELGVFVLVVTGDDERGFLIVGEVRSGQNPNPLGFFAVEWDGKNDRISVVIGVEIKIRNFLKDAPEWTDNIGRLSGTLFFGNDPGTFAIGRLADQRTWLGLRFDIDFLVFRTFIQFGFCFEFVDRPEGPRGGGLVVRMEGGMNAGIVKLTYNLGFGFVIAWFVTGSTDYSVVIWIEAGLRIKLFGFLRFGISARAELHVVGSRPSRGEMRIECRLETPWFLPDVTWTFEINFGNLTPEQLATSVSPLRLASATQGLEGKSLPVHMDRFDPNWDGQGTAPTFSILDLRAPTASEAGRISRFETNPDIRPIATDSTIAIEWGVAVNDQLALDPNVAPNLGDQKSGDLSLRYDFIAITVRRRSRFGADRSWKPLEERVELPADFSDPSGVSLTGSFAPGVLTKFWDKDVQVAGRQAAKKLLINGSTPFDFKTKNPEVDEETVRDNPQWPCCDRRKPRFKIHEVIFRNESLGAEIAAPRLFTESQSRLSFLRPAYARPQQFGTAIPPGALVAHAGSQLPGVVFRAELDKDAAFCFVRLAWRIARGGLALVAFDGAGKVVGSKTLPLGGGSDFQNVMIAGQGPIRRLEARLIFNPEPVFGVAAFAAAQTNFGAAIEVDRVAYVGLRSYLDAVLTLGTCAGKGDDFENGYEGKGKLFFLPNHDYEIGVTTRVSIEHPSKPAESSEVKEYVYFKTKGLPGLNAVERAGSEIEPYVNAAYTGGRGALYREEPVTLAFKEDFSAAVPLALRPPGAAAEQTVLMKMQLLVQPDTAATLDTPFSTTGEDWIVSHRTSVVIGEVLTWKGELSLSATVSSNMVSADPMRARLAGLTQRFSEAATAPAGCDLDDPRRVVSPVLIAPPQGEDDPANPGRKLWPAASRFSARVRQEGAGFVDRRSFEGADRTAFDFALDAGPGGAAAWSVAEGKLRVATGSVRRFGVFGEPEWNHLSIQIGVEPGSAAAGVGVALPASGAPSRGLFAVVEQTGAARRLAIYRRDSGAQWNEAASAALPAPADPAAPITLLVTAFDDRLRASVGEVVVETDRGELREGRLCLVAQGEAGFRSLQVTGLDLYGFGFAVSRFRSFENHIQSFRGSMDVIAPNALGAGTTTGTSAGLWSATQSEVQTAMQPAAAATSRQSLFDRWISALGLPLKDEVTSLEISRFEVEGKTELFLLESPEPLDFTEEVTLKLERRVRVGGPVVDPFPFDDLFPPVKMLPREVRSEERRIGRIDDARRLVRESLTLAEGVVREIAPSQPPQALKILDVAQTGDVLQIELDASFPAGNVVFAEAADVGGERRLRFYAGVVERKAGGGRATVRAELVDESVADIGRSSVLYPQEVENLRKGELIALTPDLKGILDWFRPRWIYVPVETRVLQDGVGQRAIIIPLSAGSASPLSGGEYRLGLTLERKRWQTLDPPDDLNRYRRTTTMRLSF